MWDQPVRGSAGPPGPPDRSRNGSSGTADPGTAASPDQAGDRTSDFGRFDWFADSAHFGIQGAPEADLGRNDPEAQGEERRSWRREKDDREGRRPAARPASEPGELPRWLHGWRLVAGVSGLALTCTMLGGIVGGLVAVTDVAGHTDPSYSLGAVPPAPSSRPARSSPALPRVIRRRSS